MKKEWTYKSTAKKKFGLTENQIQRAIEDGLVATKTVRNPHYTSAPPATLLRKEDIEVHLAQIEAYQKLGEEEKKTRRIYSERKKLRDKLEFFCPRCQEEIRALRGSTMFESFFTGEATCEEAREALMVAHYRHAHTNYEEELTLLRDERYETYRELRDKGYDFDEAWEKVDEQNSEDTETETDLKRQYNIEARKLLEKDGLLCRKD